MSTELFVASCQADHKWTVFNNQLVHYKSYIEHLRYDGYWSNERKSVERKDSPLEYSLNSDQAGDYKPFQLPSNFIFPELVNVIGVLPLPNLPSLEAPPVYDITQAPSWARDEPTLYTALWDIPAIEARAELLRQLKSAKLTEFTNIQQSLAVQAAALKTAIAGGYHTHELLEHTIEFVFRKFQITPLTVQLPSFDVDYTSRIALISIKFPDYAKIPVISGFTSTGKLKYATESVRKKILRSSVCSSAIFFAYLVAKYAIGDFIDVVVVNVEQNWFDPATGLPRNGVIASVQADMAYLRSLNIAYLDPESCFKHLKGLSTPTFDNLSPIRPIMTFNKEDKRFVESKDIITDLAAETNLASMDWEEFEHLVAQLFEWEFSRPGLEVKVTRASRDRGVDAVLFDPDPLRGGKYVVQAKRYTRTVDVSAVRDLYGTIMNEGANRGILITTAGFGPDAYEFAKDKPISLVDGPNLLAMLQKHGKSYRINLEEARLLYSEQSG